jgi:hypothetical protein
VTTQEFVRVTEKRASRAMSIPPDLLGKASQRLGSAALLYAIAYFLAYVPGVLFPTDLYVAQSLWHHLGASAFIAGSLAAWLLFRRTRIDPYLLLDIGLMYEVVAALGIDIWLLWTIPLLTPEQMTPHGISWVCVWIVIFPVIVPTSPGKTFLAAMAAASWLPLIFLVLAAQGVDLPSTSNIVQFVLPGYICVALAVGASRIVHGMTSEVSEARRMGSYQLVKLLGQGGMGEVWLAEHRLLARPAAVKLIRPEALGADRSGAQGNVVRRFEREAKATAALSSPHTIQLHDFGVTDDGTLYYVMELLRGLDLEEFVQRFGPMPADRVAYILRQACDSLGEAHVQGMVHRDVKPANVYLCRVGREHDFVKLLDFGLVKATEAGQQETALTAQNVAAGTPAFMAPEMAVGEPGLDGRADIYGLGCVAYWLLTGKYLFESKGPMQLVFAHVNTEPVPPSQRSEIEIPADFEDVIMRCLAKERGDRPQTTDALSGLIARTMGSDSWSSESAAEWWRTYLPELAR